MRRGRAKPGIDAVLLDAAGTLIRTVEPVALTYTRIARRWGAQLEPQEVSRAFREVFRRMPPMAFDATGDYSPDALERDWWRTLVSRVVIEVGGAIPQFDRYFDALYGYYASGSAWALYPEVVPVLSQLNAAGLPVAVVSNFDSRLPGILRDHGLEPMIAEVVFSTGVGAAKPDSRIFRLALANLGVTPSRALHVGDDRWADYEGARAAGLQALLLKRAGEGGIAGTGGVVADLEELLVRLESGALSARNPTRERMRNS